MMFLPESKWSPRYEAQFYTIRMNTYELLDKPAPTTFGNDECSLCNYHHQKHPAVYYKIEVLRGNTKHTCLRRYSQFLYLRNKIHYTERDDNMYTKKHFPHKTGPFHRDTPQFLEERMEGLCKFLMDVLLRPECVNNKWLEAFLELSSGDEDQ
eukprot:scaffold4968_cov148-Skeletonema_menzelii.AAC.1